MISKIQNYNALSRKGDADMCTVFEETRLEGLAEGIIGIGFELGMSENDILEQLQKKLDVPIQTAMEYLERFSPS